MPRSARILRCIAANAPSAPTRHCRQWAHRLPWPGAMVGASLSPPWAHDGPKLGPPRAHDRPKLGDPMDPQCKVLRKPLIDQNWGPPVASPILGRWGPPDAHYGPNESAAVTVVVTCLSWYSCCYMLCLLLLQLLLHVCRVTAVVTCCVCRCYKCCYMFVAVTAVVTAVAIMGP